MTWLDGALQELVRLGRIQGMESVSRDCDLQRLERMMEATAKQRRVIIEWVEARTHAAVKEGIEREALNAGPRVWAPNAVKR